MDANTWGEEQRRRGQMKKWLIRVWEWCEENELPIARAVAELLSRADERDYPLWSMAAKRGVTGGGMLAQMIRRNCGVPLAASPAATSWERDINYSPVIALDEPTWKRIYDELGWVNRYPDKRVNGPSFYLWSEASNPVLFVIKQKFVVNAEHDQP